jgi:hypothetical protein
LWHGGGSPPTDVFIVIIMLIAELEALEVAEFKSRLYSFLVLKMGASFFTFLFLLL